MLDEINTIPDMWVAKMLIVDRVLLGRRIPLNVTFFAMMNPKRRRTDAAARLASDLAPLRRAGAVATTTQAAHRFRRSIAQVARRRLSWHLATLPTSITGIIPLLYGRAQDVAFCPFMLLWAQVRPRFDVSKRMVFVCIPERHSITRHCFPHAVR
jgi:hypothetical protein